MHAFHALLALFAVAALALSVIAIRWEGSWYKRNGKGAAWRRVRLASFPLALGLGLVVWFSARASSGMLGLAMLYGLLLTFAPSCWFAAHWLIGSSVSPPLTFGESATMAVSPIVFALAVVSVAHALQIPAWSLLRSLGLA
jgi:hypothetical protein